MNTAFIFRLWITVNALLMIATTSGCVTVDTPEARQGAQLHTELQVPSGANCSVNVRRVSETTRHQGPLFIAVNGVPTTALIYQPLAEALVARLDATVLLVDLPGTGSSRLNEGRYTWSTQRECLRAFLLQQPEHTLIVHDAAGPILLPLLGKLPTLRQVIVFNTLLKPSAYSLPFPMNCLRSCLFLSKPLAYAAPFWFYENRFRSLGIAHNDLISEQQIRVIYDDLRNDHGMGRLVDILKGFELTPDADQAISTGLEQTIPQLFIWGMQDPVLGTELQNLTLGGAFRQTHNIADAKHFPMLDFTDESATAIAAWYQHLPR